MTEDPRAVVARHLNGLADAATRAAVELADPIAAVAALVITAFERGNKLLFCGNGGSAADAQHLATEYVVRFQHDRKPLPAIALTTDTSLLTAAANDLGFEQVFARQVEALGNRGDILFLHTTSGNSPNLLRAAESARARGVVTVAMVARGGGPLRTRVDHAIAIASDNGAHAQELQLAIGHIICALVEAHFMNRNASATSMAPATIALLHEARLEEKRQALFYRALAAAAEEIPDEELSERLNGLHADEQHHLSRLTVRLVELGESVSDMGAEPSPVVQIEGWEEVARLRERGEIARYSALLPLDLDDKTRALIDQFIEAESHHQEVLGGKWMGAEPW